MAAKKNKLINLGRTIFIIASFVSLQVFVCPNSFAMPQNGSNFMGGITNVNNINVINTGTVLTGVLQEDISSKKSKNADVFSIMLPENYIVNDRLLIPRYSKFVGTIVSVAPAKQAHHGNPGNLQVSIQTLVSPDGTSIPVTASIDYNPNQNTKTDINKPRGVPAGEWGKSVMYSIYYYGGSIGSRLGVPIFYKGQTNGGRDFSLSKGELLPIRLTEPLDVTPLLAGKTQTNMPSSLLPGTNAINQNNSFSTPLNRANESNRMPDTTDPAGPEPF